MDILRKALGLIIYEADKIMLSMAKENGDVVDINHLFKAIKNAKVLLESEKDRRN